MEENSSNYSLMNNQGFVVQSNDLIRSRQHLDWIEAKLVRLAIMQVMRNDKQFFPYKIPIKTFCDLLNIDLDLYCGKKAQKICAGLAKKPVQIQNGDGWKIIPWVSLCEYMSRNGDVTEGIITIQLNEKLKPYLIGLEKYYTQYAIDNILAMQGRNTYGIRLFELILSKVYTDLPKEGAYVTSTIEEIRICCDCETKYPKIGMLKVRVIDSAVKEICTSTIYDVEYRDILEGKKIVGFQFFIIKKYHRGLRDEVFALDDKQKKSKGKRTKKKELDQGQLSLDLESL